MKNKKKVITIISVALILIFCIIYTLSIRTVSSADILSKYNNSLTIEDIKSIDSIYNKTILFDLCTFSIFQIIALVMYIYNKKKQLKILLIIEIILFALSIAGLTIDNSQYILVYLITIVNTILYLFGLKNEEVHINGRKIS